MTFKVVIDVDNAAFEDEGMGNELARILRKVAERVEGEESPGRPVGKLQDINGNTVGSYKLVD